MAAATHFTSALPAKRVAADCLLTDSTPGGVVEADESPRTAAQLTTMLTTPRQTWRKRR